MKKVGQNLTLVVVKVNVKKKERKNNLTFAVLRVNVKKK